MKKWLWLLLLALPTAADEIVPEHDASRVLLEIVWVDKDEPRLEDDWGWASYVYDEEMGVALCVIYTARPVSVDDDWSDTLGHELLHCIYGDYHAREAVRSDH